MARVLGTAAVLGTLLSVTPASAQVVVDRVVAVVNDEAIFLSDLREAPAPYVGGTRASAPTTGSYTTIPVYTGTLEILIDRRLILQAAEEDGITVSDADVTAAIDAMSASSGLSGPAFWSAVRSQGFASREAFRADVREQLLHYRVLNARVRSRVSITEDDVRARYDELVAAAATSSPYVDVWEDIYREMLSDAMERQQELFIEELRSEAVIERRWP